MNRNINKPFFGFLIFYNNKGQIFLKKDFLSLSILHFYRYLMG